MITKYIDTSLLLDNNIKFITLLLLLLLMRMFYRGWFGYKMLNQAQAISFSGMLIGVCFILIGTTNAMVFAAEDSYTTQYTLAFALVGTALLFVNRYILDKIALPKLSLRRLLSENNLSIAIIDASHSIALAIILSHVMTWSVFSLDEGIIILLSAAILIELLLLGLTYYRKWQLRHLSTHDFQELIKHHNTPIAIRFAGHRIGAAIIIALGVQMVQFDRSILNEVLLTWLVFSLLMLFIVEKLLKFVAYCIVGSSENYHNLSNISAALFRAALYIAICLFMYQLLPAFGYNAYGG